MATEHEFAQFVRILGKGPNLSRPLTLDEAREAGRAVMSGALEPVQLGAFLCLLRVKTETPDEVAGLAQAAREILPHRRKAQEVALDWPSYSGKARQPPFFLLAALLLARAGIRVFMHGADGHTEGRTFVPKALAALGLEPAQSIDAAAEDLAARNFAYLPVERLHPRFGELFELRRLLGVRSPFHTVVRHLNPFGAGCTLIGVAHPPYRAIHLGAAKLLGQPAMTVFKGEGGEAERRPEKPCETVGLFDGQAFEEDWPPLPDLAPPPVPQAMDLGRLVRLWRGEEEDIYGTVAVISTAAIALKSLGRAPNQEAALGLARGLWADRRARESFAA